MLEVSNFINIFFTLIVLEGETHISKFLSHKDFACSSYYCDRLLTVPCSKLNASSNHIPLSATSWENSLFRKMPYVLLSPCEYILQQNLCLHAPAHSYVNRASLILVHQLTDITYSWSWRIGCQWDDKNTHNVTIKVSLSTIIMFESMNSENLDGISEPQYASPKCSNIWLFTWNNFTLQQLG